jgi:hypothetical protein
MAPRDAHDAPWGPHHRDLRIPAQTLVLLYDATDPQSGRDRAQRLVTELQLRMPI